MGFINLINRFNSQFDTRLKVALFLCFITFGFFVAKFGIFTGFICNVLLWTTIGALVPQKLNKENSNV